MTTATVLASHHFVSGMAEASLRLRTTQIKNDLGQAISTERVTTRRLTPTQRTSCVLQCAGVAEQEGAPGRSLAVSWMQQALDTDRSPNLQVRKRVSRIIGRDRF